MELNYKEKLSAANKLVYCVKAGYLKHNATIAHIAKLGVELGWSLDRGFDYLGEFGLIITARDRKLYEQISKKRYDYKKQEMLFSVYCVYYILQYLPGLSYQHGNKTVHFTEKEIAYYYYRILLQISQGNGTATIARNYFLSLGFKTEYQKQTSRKINKSKIAAFNKIFKSANLLTIDTAAHKVNTYKPGENSIFYPYCKTDRTSACTSEYRNKKIKEFLRDNQLPKVKAAELLDVIDRQC